MAHPAPTLNIAPTPWRVGPVDDTIVSAADRSEVAAIDGDYNNPDTWPIMEANARLIAAAPDLYAALVQLAHEAELADAIGYGWGAAREKARIALARVQA